MIETVKMYLRIDGTEEDMIISSLISAAKEYLLNAGIKENLNSELYKLAICLYVAHQYENRLPTGSSDRLSFSLESIILQLQLSQGSEV